MGLLGGLLGKKPSVEDAPAPVRPATQVAVSHAGPTAGDADQALTVATANVHTRAHHHRGRPKEEEEPLAPAADKAAPKKAEPKKAKLGDKAEPPLDESGKKYVRPGTERFEHKRLLAASSDRSVFSREFRLKM